VVHHQEKQVQTLPCYSWHLNKSFEYKVTKIPLGVPTVEIQFIHALEQVTQMKKLVLWELP